MKKIIALFTIIALTTGLGFAQKKDSKKLKLKETVEFRLDEEICSNCKRKIDNNIAFEKGVTNIVYGKDGNSVQVTYRADKTDTLKLRKAFDKVKLNVIESEIVTDKETK
ncbi:MAG: heavy-metal-associated domain-containing protein [Dysgonamonadaceae bacterium]|jgi:hypothetical protein|nr:heavy-metal-associated domain-containing protein [Dysgonamonadaceae bacterium]